MVATPYLGARHEPAEFAKGLTNKAAARALGTNHRTAEIQRTRIMKKTQAAFLADLVRMSLLQNLS